MANNSSLPARPLACFAQAQLPLGLKVQWTLFDSVGKRCLQKENSLWLSRLSRSIYSIYRWYTMLFVPGCKAIEPRRIRGPDGFPGGGTGRASDSSIFFLKKNSFLPRVCQLVTFWNFISVILRSWPSQLDAANETIVRPRPGFNNLQMRMTWCTCYVHYP